MAVAAKSEDTHALALERIVFFSDAVMAIAITLLAIDLRLPEAPKLKEQGLIDLLWDLAPHYGAFVASFTVIGIYWVAHHRMFRFIVAFDGGLVFLNLVFLFFVVQLPFLAAMLGDHGHLAASTAIYALGLAAMGFSSSALWAYAARRKLIVDDLPAGAVRTLVLRGLMVPIVFLASIPLAFVAPSLAQLSWLAIFPAERILSRRLAPAIGAAGGRRTGNARFTAR